MLAHDQRFADGRWVFKAYVTTERLDINPPTGIRLAQVGAVPFYGRFASN